MKKRGLILQLWGAAVSVTLTAAVLTAATYAWFSSNRIVSTDYARGRSGTANLELELSTQGGAGFRSMEEVPITQVNSTERLLPVSTADLSGFVTNRATVYNEETGLQEAKGFLPVTDESDYYHGRLYLRASADSAMSGRMALYLDQAGEAGGDLASAVAGTTAENLLNAGRLGLVIGTDGSRAGSVIFSLSGETNARRQSNTRLNGALLDGSQVLRSDGGGAVTAVSDPSVSLDSYTIRMDGAQMQLPEQPLAYLELNQVYQVDVYFYLEGCDPDCTDDISDSMADLHLAFYGVLEQ